MRRTLIPLIAAFVLIFEAGAALAQDPPPVVRLESVNFPGLFVRHSKFEAFLTEVESSLDRKDSVFLAHRALNGGPGVSFESLNFPGRYLRHRNFRLILDAYDGTESFKADASFLRHNGPAGATGFEAANFLGYFIRHKDFMLYVEPNEDNELYRADSSFMVREINDPLIGTDNITRRCETLVETQVYAAPGDDHGEALASIAAGGTLASTRRDWDWYFILARAASGREGWVQADQVSCYP
jgi:hypothetical protein